MKELVLTNCGWSSSIQVQLVKTNSFITKEAFMTLLEATVGTEYIIKDILTNDDELDSFLFTLGCYSGEPITVISRKRNNCVVSIKDGRYNIDKHLAGAITV